MEDPDAPRGAWVHWIVYDMPAGAQGLPEHVPASPELTSGGRQGRNDFGRVGYGGPCPPAGSTHRYYLRLFALDEPLTLASGSTRAELERAMRGHVIGHAELMGRYRRGA